MIPKDPAILLSYVNMNLRDYYRDLDDFCNSKDINKKELLSVLKGIDYEYDSATNQFI